MIQRIAHSGLVGVIVTVLAVGCAATAQYARGQFQRYDEHTEYHVGDRTGGFTLTVNYARYQFVPDTETVARACMSALTSIAYEMAEKQGKTIRRINPQRVRVSLGRNIWTGTTSCSASAPVEYAATAPPAEKKAAGVSHGTAFAVRPDGVFLTALHVVQDATAIKLFCPNRPSATATLAAQAGSNDLAVLRAPMANLAYLPLAKPRSVRPGDPVFTVGFPAPDMLGTVPKFTDGSVSAIAGVGNEASVLQVSVPVQPGNSGGPLLNDHGQVVGVITSSAAIRPFLAATGSLPQNVNWAVKSEYALPLFDSPTPPVAATSRREAIDRALHATCIVEATR